MISSKKKWENFLESRNTLDNFLMILGVIIVVMISWILIFDISLVTKTSLTVESVQASIAKIQFTENIVRRKSGSLPLWNVGKKWDELYLDDQIFTDENSSAQIEFNDKTTIDVAQQTLVVIRRVENQNILNLEKGSISAKFTGAGSLVLEANKTRAVLTSKPNTTIEIVSGKNKTPRISVLEGEVKIESKGETVGVVKNQQTEINNETLQIRPTAVALLSPAHDVIMTEEQATNLNFVWESSLNQEQIFEISVDQNFKNIFKTVISSENKVTIFHLPANSYFWRVKPGQDNSTDWSSIRRLNIIANIPAALVYPNDNEVIKTTLNGNRIYFDWQKIDRVDSYSLELAQNEKFENKKSFETKTNPYLSDVLQSGSYYWRVCAQVSDKNLCSMARRFVIGEKEIQTIPQEQVKEPEVPLAPPKLERKYRIKNQPKIPKQGKLRKILRGLFEDTAYAKEAEESRIDWEAVPQAASYDVQVSKEKEFKTIILEKNVLQNSFSLEGLPAGLYYLRIRSVQKGGQRSPYSEASTLFVGLSELKLVHPSEGQEIEKVSDNLKVEFEWESLPDLKEYTFELFNSKEAKNPIIKEKVVGHKTIRSFTRLGTFYWRVGFQLQDDNYEYSVLRSLNIVAAKAKSPKLPANFIVKREDNGPPVSMAAPGSNNMKVEWPIVKRSRPEKSSFYLSYLPTYLESTESTSTKKEYLSFLAFDSVKADTNIWISESWGINFGYHFLQTQLFKDSDDSQKSAQILKLENISANMQYRRKITLLAESMFYMRLGYLRLNTPKVERVENNIRVLKRTLSGPEIGVGFGRAVSEKVWFHADLDYLYATTSLRVTPLHLFSKIQLDYLFDSKLSLGCGYSLEFAKYYFKENEADEQSELILRKQSLGLILGYSL